MRISIGFLAALAVAAPTFADTLMTFEEAPFQAADVQAVNDFYDGVTFGSSSSGSPLVTRNYLLGSYNVSSWPSGNQTGSGEYWIYDNVGVTSALDGSGNDGKISFDNADATYVSVGYCCNSTFTVEAYDINDNLIDSDAGGGNLRYSNGNAGGPGTLTVNWDGSNYIAYIIVHDTGNFWVIDNVKTDASGIVIPAPGAALLGVLGLSVVRSIKRRLA